MVQGGAGHGRRPVPSCVELGSCIPDRGLCKGGGYVWYSSSSCSSVKLLQSSCKTLEVQKCWSFEAIPCRALGTIYLPLVLFDVFLPGLPHVLPVKL